MLFSFLADHILAPSARRRRPPAGQPTPGGPAADIAASVPARPACPGTVLTTVLRIVQTRTRMWWTVPGGAGRTALPRWTLRQGRSRRRRCYRCTRCSYSRSACPGIRSRQAWSRRRSRRRSRAWQGRRRSRSCWSTAKARCPPTLPPPRRRRRSGRRAALSPRGAGGHLRALQPRGPRPPRRRIARPAVRHSCRRRRRRTGGRLPASVDRRLRAVPAADARGGVLPPPPPPPQPQPPQPQPQPQPPPHPGSTAC